jgi:hypothetical protein
MHPSFFVTILWFIEKIWEGNREIEKLHVTQLEEREINPILDKYIMYEYACVLYDLDYD